MRKINNRQLKTKQFMTNYTINAPGQVTLLNSFPMDKYEERIKPELITRQKKMMKRPSLLNSLSKKVQTRINSLIPEKVHSTLTAVIKQMIRTVLFGAMHTTSQALL